MLVAALLVSLAAAQAPLNWCRQESFVHAPSFQVAGITTTARLLRDDGACPVANDLQCGKAGELSAGSEVLVAHRYRGLACVWFQPPDEVEKVGWIPEFSLKLKDPQPSSRNCASRATPAGMARPPRVQNR